jgi:hypothetical protein
MYRSEKVSSVHCCRQQNNARLFDSKVFFGPRVAIYSSMVKVQEVFSLHRGFFLSKVRKSE